jgi:polyhydroxyalkanoate synthesis regulator phasin
MSEPHPGPTSTETLVPRRRGATDLLQDLLRSGRSWFESLEADMQPLLGRLGSLGRHPGEEMKIAVAEIVKRWNAKREELEQWLDDELTGAWDHLRVPNDDDIRQLVERLDALERRIDELATRQGGGPRE